MSEFYDDYDEDFYEDDDPYDDEEEVYEDDEGRVDATFLVEAMRGQHGPEMQAQAFELAGIEVEDDDYYDDDEDAAWTQEFIAQQQRLERQIGRELTGKEIESMAQDSYLSEQPNLQESWKRIGRDLSNDDDRQAYMAEVMEEESDLQDAQARIEADGPEADSPAVEAMVGAMEGDE